MPPCPFGVTTAAGEARFLARVLRRVLRPGGAVRIVVPDLGAYARAYAAAHPWEDWSESWAHHLHLRSALETVTSCRLNTARVDLRIDPFTRDVLYRQEPVEAGDAFLAWINAWVVLTAVLNEVARSMGQPDAYPFVLNGPVVTKLHFVHCAIRGREDAPVIPPPASLAQPEG